MIEILTHQPSWKVSASYVFCSKLHNYIIDDEELVEWAGGQTGGQTGGQALLHVQLWYFFPCCQRQLQSLRHLHLIL